jgi:hypothetical protein
VYFERLGRDESEMREQLLFCVCVALAHQLGVLVACERPAKPLGQVSGWAVGGRDCSRVPPSKIVFPRGKINLPSPPAAILNCWSIVGRWPSLPPKQLI